MAHRTTRRKFMKTTAAIGAGYWVAGGVSPRESRAAVDQINFASIGVGGKGRSDSTDASRNGNMVAICDVDENNLNRAVNWAPKAEKFSDWRKMLDKLGKSIDAVTVSTPDHTHGPASVWAMKQGIHCFTQKPLSHSIEEARVMGTVAKEMKVQTMMGNQGTANNGLREAVAIIRGGHLGAIKEVHVFTNRPVWPQGLDRPAETPSVPESLNWDVWLGPAKERPYHQAYHPFKWRGWWDFGTGALGDMACHTLNMPYAGCELKDPTSVVAETAGHNGETYPKWSEITFQFPKTDWRGPITLKWYDGGKKPADELFDGHKLKRSNSGALVVCEKGTIHSNDDYCGRYEIIGAEVDKSKIEYEKSPGHFNEWVRAIKGGQPAMSNFPGYAGPLTEVILLGNLAVWACPEEGVGKKIEWDAQKLEATNAPEVAHIVRKAYRKGFALHGPEV